MDDSDDYGDFDDTELLEVATQAEQVSFQPSPRPSKRRKIADIPPRPINNNRRAVTPGSGDASEIELSPISTTSSWDSHAHSPREQRRKSVSSTKENGQHDGESGISKYMQKKKDRIHVPAAKRDLADAYATQAPLEDSPPWKPRGGIWQKPALTIGVHRPAEPSAQSVQRNRNGLERLKAAAYGSESATSSAWKESDAAKQSAFPDETNKPPNSRTPRGREQEYDLAQELADLPSDAFSSSAPSPQGPDDDVVLLSAKRTRLVAPQTGFRQTTLFGRNAAMTEVPPSQVNKRYNFVATQKDEPPTHHKLDHDALKTWVYPTNIGVIRDYQFNIVARALYHNLLVALPTGLGKTFIAATVMLNWFRWTTDAQIVFVAPTRPLVAQQVEACFKIAGIPRSQTTMLIGGVATGLRAEEWKSKRVFFMTPQTLDNDLKSGIADPKKIVLLVVDEAHKATGSYAYTKVVALLRRFNPSYRILALTATPGSDVEAVQKVIDGLDISRVEIRTENSMDITQYVHQRNVEKKIFTYDEDMEFCMDLYSKALQPSVSKLAACNAHWSSDPLTLTPYGCTQSSRKWMLEAGRNAPQGQKFMVMNLFATLGSLSQGMELLKYHAIGAFYSKMKEFRDSNSESKAKAKREICDSEHFKKLMSHLQKWVSNEGFVGHPKLEYTQQVILEHFVNAGEGHHAEGAPTSQTRIMVFAHFRDSAEEIVRVLKRHEPMVRPHIFVGQSSSKNSEGMAQKEQLEVIEKFKDGKYNTLVATSIGEEGLDIGEVDLIICYDSKASPLRMLQRMGRTGRKRQGRIVLLQMQGKEEQDFLKAKDSYEKMQHLIADGSRFTFHDDISRRIVPWDVQPVPDRRVVDIPVENSQSDFLPEPKKKGRVPKKPPKKFHMPDGVITGFVTANRMDEEVAPKWRGKKKAAPVYPSEEPYQAAPLEEILLDANAMKDLKRRYQTVYDGDDAIVAPPRYDRYPARQRVLRKSKHFRKPGRATQMFVETLQRMHTINDRSMEELLPPIPDLDYDLDFDDVVVDPGVTNTVDTIAVPEDMWASDDPASQRSLDLPARTVPKAKPRGIQKAKGKVPAPVVPQPQAAATVDPFDIPDDMWTDDDPLSPTKLMPPPKVTPKQKAKAGRKSNENASTDTTPISETANTPARSRQNLSHTTPARPNPRKGATRPTFRMSAEVEEGASSSPPPTDPRMRLASQAVDLGSQDTEGEDEPDDTQAYLLDSDLRDFIAGDDEQVDAPESSLPSLDLGSVGAGTQAVLRSAKKAKRPRVRGKLFTSDVTEVDVFMSSDSDEDERLQGPIRGKLIKKTTYTVDSASGVEDESGEDQPELPSRKRVRRVVDDDDEDN